MRFSFISAAASVAVAAVLLVGCGSSGPSKFGPGDGGENDAGFDPDSDPFQDLDSSTDGGPPCVGLQCQQVTCTTGKTTVSGKVYDPGGKNPLYNVFVYVPNAQLQPFAQGVTCSACQAPASGSPVVSTSTKADGSFVLDNVPVGADIPIVLQVGKWRRRMTIPTVTACQDNPQADKTLRLPKNKSEGDIPLMALATGCDQAECFIRNTIGLDAAEFTGPSGSGRVHIYKGDDISQGLPANPGDAYTLWGSLATMKKYDLVFNACECTPSKRDTAGPAYTNMKSYLEAGGRVFGTHYHYNWFASPSQCSGFDNCNGPTDFASVADWQQSQFLSSPYLINTALPKGKALADWYVNVTKGTSYAAPLGQLPLVDVREDVGKVTANKATQWIYTGTPQNYDTYYLSFNTPVNQPVNNQCGKAVFSDVHLVDSFNNYSSAWPSSCTGGSFQDHKPNELALEFLFFDLASCVQDETQPPPPIPN